MSMEQEALHDDCGFVFGTEAEIGNITAWIYDFLVGNSDGILLINPVFKLTPKLKSKQFHLFLSNSIPPSLHNCDIIKSQCKLSSWVGRCHSKSEFWWFPQFSLVCGSVCLQDCIVPFSKCWLQMLTNFWPNFIYHNIFHSFDLHISLMHSSFDTWCEGCDWIHQTAHTLVIFFLILFYKTIRWLIFNPTFSNVWIFVKITVYFC